MLGRAGAVTAGIEKNVVPIFPKVGRAAAEKGNRIVRASIAAADVNRIVVESPPRRRATVGDRVPV